MKAIVKKKMLPELRFDEFQKEYRILKFNNIVKLRKKKIDPIKSNDSFKSVELESIEKETGLLVKTFDSENLKSLKTKFHKGDILFGKLRPYLRKFYFCEFEGICTSEIWAFYSNSECNKYVYYLIQTSKFNYQVNLTTGTRMPRADWNQISTTKFRIPSFKEQQKIANFLTAIDQRITLLKEKKAALEDYKKGLMQKIFSQEVRFVDDEENDWKEFRFDELYEFKRTNSFSREKLNYENGEVFNIHYGDIHTKFKTHFDLSNEMVPFVDGQINLSKINEDEFIQIGDLVIADASEDYDDIGKAIEITQIQNHKIIAGLHTFLARRINNELEVGFGGYVMQSADVRHQIKKIAQGTKVLGISMGRLGEIVLKLPSIEEQQKIANFLSAIDQKINAINKQIADSELFKKGLLQRMFV